MTDPMRLISKNKCFGGMQFVYAHVSQITNCTMRFGLFLPEQAHHLKVPTLYWLSGLTCTEENFIIKAGAQRVAAKLGLAMITPDTSPRELNIQGEKDSYDLGVGAGFYVDAIQSPWDQGYRMYSYITKELPALVHEHFAVDSHRVGILGHSMGGHGALTIALKNPDYFKSVSAFAPISSAIRSPWGEKALQAYLGPNRKTWADYDAVELISSRGWAGPEILVDQGTQDIFLQDQLKPDLLRDACDKAGIKLKLRMQEGYDHSYFFIMTFIEDHLTFHARHL